MNDIVADLAHRAFVKVYPKLSRDLTILVNGGQGKRQIMNRVRRAAGAASNSPTVLAVECEVDYLLHEKKAANA